MREHPKIRWETSNICENSNFKVSQLLQMYGRKLVNMDRLSSNRGLRWTDVVANPDLEWNWVNLTRNESAVSWQQIWQMRRRDGCNWNWSTFFEFRVGPMFQRCVSGVGNNLALAVSGLMSKWTVEMTIFMQELVIELKDGWMLDCVPMNQWSACESFIFQFVPLDVLLELREKEYLRWSWGPIASNASVTLEIINTNTHVTWNCAYLSLNPNLTVKDIVARWDKGEWSIHRLSMNPSVTLEDVLAHKDWRWNYIELCRNENIRLDDILRTVSELPWDLSGLMDRSPSWLN